MGDELRACPFVQCGGKAQAVFASPSGAYVQCTQCETTTRVIDENMTEAENMASAVALWNSRSPTRPAERDAEGWLPIESAPKGEYVLLCGYLDGLHDPRIKLGYWCLERKKWSIDGASWRPRFWQPLPAAPQREQVS